MATAFDHMDDRLRELQYAASRVANGDLTGADRSDLLALNAALDAA